MSDLIEMSLEDVASRCNEETARWQHKQPADDRFCFELFRRAILHRDSKAWEAIIRQYERLVQKWLALSPRRVRPYELEDLVQDALLRFLRRMSPDQFERFPHLGSLLNYLRVCAVCVKIDFLRKGAQELSVRDLAAGYDDDMEDLLQTIAAGAAASETVEELAIAAAGQRRLGDYIKSHLSEQEFVVLSLRYASGLMPREIQAVDPNQFQTVDRVYAVLEAALARLRHDPHLARLWREQ